MSKLALVIFSLGLTTLSAPAWTQQASGPSQGGAASTGQTNTKPATAARKPAKSVTAAQPCPAGRRHGNHGLRNFSDSKPVPGQEVYGQRPGSYVGMSLSVPSLNKALPTLLPPPAGRSEW